LNDLDRKVANAAREVFDGLLDETAARALEELPTGELRSRVETWQRVRAQAEALERGRDAPEIAAGSEAVVGAALGVLGTAAVLMGGSVPVGALGGSLLAIGLILVGRWLLHRRSGSPDSAPAQPLEVSPDRARAAVQELLVGLPVRDREYDREFVSQIGRLKELHETRDSRRRLLGENTARIDEATRAITELGRRLGLELPSHLGTAGRKRPPGPPSANSDGSTTDAAAPRISWTTWSVSARSFWDSWPGSATEMRTRGWRRSRSASEPGTMPSDFAWSSNASTPTYGTRSSGSAGRKRRPRTGSPTMPSWRPPGRVWTSWAAASSRWAARRRASTSGSRTWKSGSRPIRSTGSWKRSTPSCRRPCASGVVHLSTGTREQVYFSLRLAIMDHLDSEGERLPVLVDEAFVNWDPSRRERLLGILDHLARTRQVFVFTCHPEWAEQLTGRGGRLVELGESTGGGAR